PLDIPGQCMYSAPREAARRRGYLEMFRTPTLLTRSHDQSGSDRATARDILQFRPPTPLSVLQFRPPTPLARLASLSRSVRKRLASLRSAAMNGTLLILKELDRFHNTLFQRDGRFPGKDAFGFATIEVGDSEIAGAFGRMHDFRAVV